MSRTTLTENYEYDEDGNLILSEDAESWRQGWRYDALGRVTHAMDKRGLVTNTEYSARGLPSVETAYEGVPLTSPEGGPAKWENLITNEGYRQFLNDYVCDVADEITGSEAVEGRTILSKTTYASRDNRGLVSRVQRLHRRVSDASGDQAAEVETSWTKDGKLFHQSGADIPDTDCTYDSMGRMTSKTTGGLTTRWKYDDSTWSVRITRPDGRRIRQVNDPTTNESTTHVIFVEPGNHIGGYFGPDEVLVESTKYSRAGLLLERESGSGLETIKQYDASLRWREKTSKTWGAGGTRDSALETTHTQEFDELGRIKNQAVAGHDGTDVVTTYGGHGLFGATEIALGTEGSTKTVETIASFDRNGNKTQWTDANGVTFAASYDGGG